MRASGLIFGLLVLAVTILGFWASRWRRHATLATIDEWAFAGRSFGTVVSWFLIGGDLYTAYTFIAVPALAYAAGAFAFFAVPYTIVVYPFAIVVLARFWSLSSKRGYATAADFVRERFGDRSLEILIALTSMISIVPYIALQLVGMKVVFLQLGGAFAASGGLLALTVSFLLLAAYTYTSGLRAPALIAFIKDTLIYLTIICAVVAVTHLFGGWGGIFDAAAKGLAAKPKPATLTLPHSLYFAYSSLVLGSAFALFIYPHSITSVLSAKSRLVVQRNMALLPIYSLLLGVLALLGFAGIAAGIHVKNPQLVVPVLFGRIFPDWFAGVAYAAIVIGALVPAAIMAIGGANTFASNLAREFSPERDFAETRTAKITTLTICIVALLFVVFIQPQFAIGFQFLGGAWILQIFPAFVLGLYTRWFHPKALILGWIAGIAAGTYMAVVTQFTANYPLHLFGGTLVGYGPFYALILNLLVAVVATWILNATGVARGTDATSAADYAA
jgi:solute:Na+ symporter, SSS family